MVGYKARTLLAKTAGLNFVISVAMIVFHIFDRHDPDGTLIALWLVLFVSGTVIASIRHDSAGGPIDKIIDRIVDAFIASRPDDGCGQTLRLVAPQETGSTIPSPRRSVL